MINTYQCKHLINHLLFVKRFYGKKLANIIPSLNMKRVHQEQMRYISPNAQINILSDINVQVKTINLHDYPDGNAFIAELHGGAVNNTTTSMTINVSTDDLLVEVILKNLKCYSDFHCELAIPIRAALNIQTNKGATIERMCGNELNILANDFIKTEEIRSENIRLQSKSGNIRCRGLLLAKHTHIETIENGSILLEKVLGDHLKCKTISGNITANCSYVNNSKFETDTGCLLLNNIHKHAEVLVHKQGQLQMMGVHGNLHVNSKGGTINLQLSELDGDNSIEVENLQCATIHISKLIEQNIDIFAHVMNDEYSINLDKSLMHLTNCLMANNHDFKMIAQNPQGQLTISCKNSSLTMAKSSWEDALRERMLTTITAAQEPTTSTSTTPEKK